MQITTGSGQESRGPRSVPARPWPPGPGRAGPANNLNHWHYGRTGPLAKPGRHRQVQHSQRQCVRHRRGGPRANHWVAGRGSGEAGLKSPSWREGKCQHQDFCRSSSREEIWSRTLPVIELGMLAFQCSLPCKPCNYVGRKSRSLVKKPDGLHGVCLLSEALRNISEVGQLRVSKQSSWAPSGPAAVPSAPRSKSQGDYRIFFFGDRLGAQRPGGPQVPGRGSARTRLLVRPVSET